MAETLSRMLPLGTKAPDFELPDTVSGNEITLSEVRGEMGTVIMFICNHCPFVVHIREEVVKIAKAYDQKGISFVAISSNDIANYPQDSPEKMRELAAECGFNFPYLYDESQDVAQAYDAACTPDFYLFDSELKLYYRGRMDESRPGNDVEVTGNELRGAIDRLLSGMSFPSDQYPSIGCNIKWKG